MTPAGEIVIRDMEGLSDYDACARLQQAVWAFPDSAAEIVPASFLVVMHHYGGICLGAFDDSQMVGFAAGFLATEGGRLFHHSHMLAVLEAYRGRGVGVALKRAQRDRALAQKIDLMNWTFDPLQAVNANFNIHRLGAVVQKYIVDIYGTSDSPLHGGLPTDRFDAEWWLESRRVIELMNSGGLEREGWEKLPKVNSTRDLGNGFRGLEDASRLELDDDAILVEIPADFTEMMAQEPELALEWRMKSRDVFQRYFPRYRVEGFHRAEGQCFYRLEKMEGR